MLNLKTLAFATLIASACAGAMARPVVVHAPAPDTHEIDARQARQAARIESAFHDGRLSRREFRSLRREQAGIRRYEAQAKADGVLTHDERRTLDELPDRAARNIRRS
jgi:hypothetical protein